MMKFFTSGVFPIPYIVIPRPYGSDLFEGSKYKKKEIVLPTNRILQKTR